MDDHRLADRPIHLTTFREQLAGYLLGQILNSPLADRRDPFEALARIACDMADSLIAELAWRAESPTTKTEDLP